MFQYYQLIGTQNHHSAPDFKDPTRNGHQGPTTGVYSNTSNLINAALESYTQTNHSCIQCHVLAGPHGVKTQASQVDQFRTLTFLLQLAKFRDTTAATSPSAVVVGDTLECFYQGSGKLKNSLRSNVFDGQAWEGDRQVYDVTMTASPSAVTFKGQTYVLHQGAENVGIQGAGDERTKLWYDVFNGAGWEGDKQVPETTLTGSPSAVVFQKQLHCFHQGAGKAKTQLWHNFFDGKSWRGDKQISNTFLTDSPSAVVFGGKLYCFYQGAKETGTEGTLRYNVLVGDQWQGDKPVSGTTIRQSPSAVVFNGQLYCFHQGNQNPTGRLWYNVFNGEHWSGDRQVPETSMSLSPSAAVFNSQLYCFYQGAGKTGELWYNVLADGGWSCNKRVEDPK